MILEWILDITIFVLIIELLQKYIFNKEPTADDKLFLEHSNPIFLYFILLLMVMGLIWSVLTDFISYDYDIMAHLLPIIGFYILVSKGLYIRYVYGPKNWQHVEKTKIGFISIIILIIIFIGLYIS